MFPKDDKISPVLNIQFFLLVLIPKGPSNLLIFPAVILLRLLRLLGATEGLIMTVREGKKIGGPGSVQAVRATLVRATRATRTSRCVRIAPTLAPISSKGFNLEVMEVKVKLEVPVKLKVPSCSAQPAILDSVAPTRASRAFLTAPNRLPTWTAPSSPWSPILRSDPLPATPPWAATSRHRAFARLPRKLMKSINCQASQLDRALPVRERKHIVSLKKLWGFWIFRISEFQKISKIFAEIFFWNFEFFFQENWWILIF